MNGSKVDDTILLSWYWSDNSTIFYFFSFCTDEKSKINKDSCYMDSGIIKLISQLHMDQVHSMWNEEFKEVYFELKMACRIKKRKHTIGVR